VDCHGKDLGGKTVMNNGAMGRIDGPNLTHGQGGLPTSYRTQIGSEPSGMAWQRMDADCI